MAGGSLEKWMASNKPKLTPKLQVRILLQIAHGLNRLHRSKPQVIHRDLKPANCLVWDEECTVVKLADLGVAKIREGSQTMTRAEQAGTPMYMAPEMHRNEPYNTSADVFSFGLVCWEIYSLEKPFKGLTMYQLIKNVGEGNLRPTPIPSTLPPELKMLMERCWQKEPKDRPEMKEAVAVLDGLLRKL